MFYQEEERRAEKSLPYQYLVLKRNKRIGRRDNIEDIKENGQTIDGRLLIIRVRKNDLDYNRYAVNVSKKMEKSAVKRNRVRRQIQEVIRLNEKSDTITQKSLDIVIFARKSLMKLKYSEIETTLIETLKTL